MRLYLAVAVLMLAFVAYTEAQDAGQTVEERFSWFREHVTDRFQTAFENIKNSEFATKAKSFFDDALETAKTKYTELSQ